MFPLKTGDYDFLDLDLGPVWISTSYIEHHNTSTDGGLTYFWDDNQLIYGTFFFLSEQKVDHKRNLYNFVDLLSELGGIFTTIYGVLNLMGNYMNT